MKLQRILLVVLLIILVNVNVVNAKTAYTDVPSDFWAISSIEKLSELGYITGFPNGEFGVDNKVTRAQAASVLARWLQDSDENKVLDNPFIDVSTHWAKEDILFVVNEGIMNGSGNGTFAPDEIVNRAEMATILVNTLDVKKKADYAFHDVPNSHWASEAIKNAYSNGLVNGIGNYLYGPNAPVSRAQFATFIVNALEINPNYIAEPIPVPVIEKNDANNLKTVGNNSQLILVTSNSVRDRNVAIQTFERNISGNWVRKLITTGFVGKNGMDKTKEGDKKTPTGKFTIGTTFGQIGNPGTKMPFRNITSDDVWVDDSNSSLYNTWQSKSKTKGQWNSAENMTHKLYKYGFVINYNTTERIPYKGSAIFFHTGTSYTAGCVATSEGNVVSILNWLNPSKNPVIIITTKDRLSAY